MLKTTKPIPAKTTFGLIYGPSGTGKTTFASTCPKALMIDVNEFGTDSILGANIDVIYINSWEEAFQIKQELMHDKIYQTIVIDTITSLQDLRFKFLTKNKMYADFGDLTKAQWGGIASDLKTFLYDLKDCGKNILILAHQRTFGGNEDGEEGLNPEKNARLMPSVVTTLNGLSDFICNSFINERRVKEATTVNGKRHVNEVRKFEYCLRTGPNPVYVTKIRNSAKKVPEYIVNASWNDIINIMKGTDKWSQENLQKGQQLPLISQRLKSLKRSQ